MLCVLAGSGGWAAGASGQQQQTAAQQAAGQQATPQQALPAGTPQSWAEAAAHNELSIMADDGSFPLRYRTHQIDAKGDTTREVIETRQGAVARLIERDGQPLTAAQDAAERARLEEELASRADFLKRRKRETTSRDDFMELVRLLPRAMINTYAPGQPQPPHAASLQIVLDFQPNPAFRPPTMLADVLTGFGGRVWIDSRSRRMTRIEAHVLRPVNFGWGIVGRIYPGGKIEFEQANPGSDRWIYSHVDAHLTVRLVVKTMPMNDQMTATDFLPLPAPVSFEQGIHMLLSMPVRLR
jgi:hypothetical protein